MIVTFYSFKGGVGRSMAVANVGQILADRGLDVLLVDFDLEAPGLERFFDFPEALTRADDIEASRGVIDMLVSYRELRALPPLGEQLPRGDGGAFPFPVEPLLSFAAPLVKTSAGGNLRLIPAGRRAGDQYEHYAERIRTFDWDEFYARWDGEAYFDWFREQAELLADIVLIDSRTGITELGGVSTFQLADVVVICVAPNDQNLDGSELVARSLQNRRLIDEGRHGRDLHVVPVPSRVDNSESPALQAFKDAFESRLEPFAPRQLEFDNSLFTDLKVPYVPAYAFRETIAVREPKRAVATELIGAYQRLTAAVVALSPTTSHIYRVFHGASLEPALEPDQPLEDFVAREWVVDRVHDWLKHGKSSLLVITGEPGSGKTSMVRWLAKLSGETATLGGTVVYAHHSRGADDPRDFVEALARRLASQLPTYAPELMSSRRGGINVDLRQNISATGPSSIVLGDVSVGGVPADLAFDELVRAPLARVTLPFPLLVLVDALDTAGPALVDLLAYASSSPKSPLRFLVTSRRDQRLLAALRGDTFDLVADAPAGNDDVAQFVRRQVATLNLEDGEQIVRQLTELSGGNFLLARVAFDAFRQMPDQSLNALPIDSLEAYFGDDLRRYLAADPDLAGRERFLLAVLGVARAGFTRAELAGIVGASESAVDELLIGLRQFLRTDENGALFLFHPALAALVLAEPGVGVYVVDAHLAIVAFLVQELRGRLRDYALRFALTHLLEGLERTSNRSQRQEIVPLLTRLVADPAFLEARIQEYGLASLAPDVEGAARILPDLTHFEPVSEFLRSVLATLAERLREDEATASAADLVAQLLPYVGYVAALAYARGYEALRESMSPGNERTAAMNGLLGEVRALTEAAPAVPIDLPQLLQGSPGERIVGLAVLQARPDPDVFGYVTAAIGDSQSAFEQFHALNAAQRLLRLVGPEERIQLVAVLDAERRDVRGLGIRDDASRWVLINDLLLQIADEERGVATT